MGLPQQHCNDQIEPFAAASILFGSPWWKGLTLKHPDEKNTFSIVFDPHVKNTYFLQCVSPRCSLMECWMDIVWFWISLDIYGIFLAPGPIASLWSGPLADKTGHLNMTPLFVYNKSKFWKNITGTTLHWLRSSSTVSSIKSISPTW